jgi:photosynthetic reaction center cytochrome c subunit
VNCTFCHNTRAMADWTQSTPQRVTAWYGIEMARDLNVDYLDPLQPVYPEHRLGSLGDAPKANCATCHQGVNKPLYGAAMVKDFPSLTVEASTSAMGQVSSEAASAVATSEAVDREEAEGI